MKKAMTKHARIIKDMRAEYDFSGGVRGKHADALRQGYMIALHQPDGTTVVEQVVPTDGAVILDPDVREYFPDQNQSTLRGVL